MSCKRHRRSRPRICFCRSRIVDSPRRTGKTSHASIFINPSTRVKVGLSLLPNISREHTFLTPESSEGFLKQNRWRKKKQQRGCRANGSIWTELSRSSCVCQDCAPVARRLLQYGVQVFSAFLSHSQNQAGGPHGAKVSTLCSICVSILSRRPREEEAFKLWQLLPAAVLTQSTSEHSQSFAASRVAHVMFWNLPQNLETTPTYTHVTINRAWDLKS